jgi:hypothetical protein
MSNSAIGASSWAEMSEAQKIEAVSTGRATLKEMVEGLLDGQVQLRAACQNFLANSDVCLERIQQENKINCEQSDPSELDSDHDDERSEEEKFATAAHSAAIENARKRRQGLPEGYVPRLYKH